MKINQPNTGKEVVMKPGSVLVSKTDLKGAITYCNRDFIEISGYSYPELMGENHNIVRHPVMPSVAFEDLWDTVKAGKPWAGIVKNRAKNGDHYWVKANVSALYKDGEISEYISVRTCPSAEEIAGVETLYDDVNSGKSGLGPTGMAALKEGCNNVNAGSLITFMSIVMAALLVGMGYAANEGVDNSIIVTMLFVTAVLPILFGLFVNKQILTPIESISSTLEQVANGDYFNWIEVSERNDHIGKAVRSLKSAQIRLGFDVMDAREQADAAIRLKTALDVVETNVMVADPEYNIIYTNASLQQTFLDAESEIQKKFSNFKADQLVGSNIDSFHVNPTHQRSILDNLKGKLTAELIVGGRVFNIVATPVLSANGHRLGTVVEWQDRTEALSLEAEKEQSRERERIISLENSQIKVALDNVSTSVMLADNDRNIIYLNNEVIKMFNDISDDLRQDFPDFDVATLLGTSIDNFHKDPNHQKQLLLNLDSSHRAEVLLSGHTLAFVANPVIDANGDRLGTTLEWRDRTLEVAVEREIDDLVTGALTGNLQTRLDIENKTGFFQELSLGINEFVDVVENLVGDVATVMSAMVEGDLSKRMTGTYSGSFDAVKININETTSKLSEIVTQLRSSTKSVLTGSQEISAGNDNLSSRTEQQASVLEKTSASMEHMTTIVRSSVESAQKANQVSVSARKLAEKGGAVVGEAIEAMGLINKSSNEIAEIIGVIDDIAFQTNLLALNASVEAARAGEQGKGFAVVATEVRNLASRSADAAKEIKELIQDSVKKVEIGSNLVNESGETLEEIVAAIKKVGDIISESAAAGTEQSEGIEEVGKSISSIEEVTQQNAALAEQTSAASSSLQETSSEMDELMDFFTVTGNRSKQAAKHSGGSITSEKLQS